MVIGIIELVLLIFNLIGGIANYAAGKGFQGSNNQAVGISGLVGGIVGVIIGLIVVALLIYGLRKERPGFLIPHMVMQVNLILPTSSFQETYITFFRSSE